LGRKEWEIVDLRRSIGLIVAPTVLIGVPPLCWIKREIIDEQGSKRLVVAPTITVGVFPLRGFVWKGV
jgi:hypothetical protein